VDARAVIGKTGACYTMFNALHHFSDTEKLNLLLDMRKSRVTAYIAEILQPGLFCLIKVVLMTTVGQLFLAPFVKPFSWKRLFFTWIIPVNLITVTWDGVVSVLKSRTYKQYQLLFAGEKNVHVKRMGSFLAPVIVIEINPA
ncbi:MAG TPA: hypothetical protein VD905_04475, partial [Flavobacteriales bacterium]|nr:hypothetical protein [Flavobacteriales bacterium]